MTIICKKKQRQRKQLAEDIL